MIDVASIHTVFTDPVAGDHVSLEVNGPQPSFFDGHSGVRHPGCDRLADVLPDLDAFYCPECRRNGRISGAWALGTLKAVSGDLTKLRSVSKR